MAESISVSVPVIMSKTLAISAAVAAPRNRAAPPGVDAVPFEQELPDFLLGLGDQLVAAGGGEDRVDVVEHRALQPLADRRVGHHDDVVLVLADHVGALAPSTPMTRNGMFLMRIIWSIGSLV